MLPVSEADIGGVAEGQDVEFVVDAFPTVKMSSVVHQARNAALTNQNVITYTTADRGAKLQFQDQAGNDRKCRNHFGRGKRRLADKEDFSELVERRLRDIESMFSSDLEVVHRHETPVKTVRDDGLPKGSRRSSSSARNDSSAQVAAEA